MFSRKINSRKINSRKINSTRIYFCASGNIWFTNGVKKIYVGIVQKRTGQITSGTSLRPKVTKKEHFSA